MAEETIINGVDDDRTVEITRDEERSDNSAKISVLMQSICALEQEKLELVHENEIITQRINKLKEEIEGLEADKAEMKKEIGKSESDKKALEAIAARAAELEAEISRLQHDLITSVTEGQEANAESFELRKVVNELKASNSDNGLRLEAIAKERNLLLERVEKGSHIERKRIEDLESRIGGLEEEYMKKIDDKEEEIRVLQKIVEELQSVVNRNKVEMERSNKEREESEIVKNELEALLKKSKKRVKETESNVGLLQKELDALEKVIWGFKQAEKEKGFDGKRVVVDRGLNGDGEKGLMGMKLDWPVVVASTGMITVVAVVCYLQYVRKR